MANFSEADINDAKRRVREMQNRANNFVSEPKRNNNDFNSFSQSKRNNTERKEEKHTNQKKSQQEEKEKGQKSILDLFADGDKSQLIILALIFVLSREGADNMLILALLYLLL